MRRLATWFFSLALFSCAPDGETPRSVGTGLDRQGIIGGTVANGDPAVVAFAAQGEQFCTGTLIAPRTVLTAAHCINTYGRNVNYSVEFGTDSSNPTRRVRVTEQFAHPNYNGQIRDLGVLRLETAVTNVTPIPLNTVPFTNADVGRDIRHVGYGVTNAASGTGQGIKREVTYKLRRFDAWLLESGGTGKQTCSGDSGGPAFMAMGGAATESLVGIISWGDEDCAQLGIDTRVDSDLSWIRSTMANWEAPSCEQDGRCVQNCASPDQDCACAADGVCSLECRNLLNDPDCPKDCVANNVCSTQPCPTPDVDCVEVGKACRSNLSCSSRACIADPQSDGATYCSQPCSDLNPCPSGMECSEKFQCQFVQKPEKGFGEVCSAADYCLSRGICTGPVGEARRCTSLCSVSSQCPAAFTCEVGIDDVPFCRAPTPILAPPIELAPAPGAFSSASGCQSTSSDPAGLLFFLALSLGWFRKTS